MRAHLGVDVGVTLATLVRHDHVLIGHVTGGHRTLGTGGDVGDLRGREGRAKVSEARKMGKNRSGVRSVR